MGGLLGYLGGLATLQKHPRFTLVAVLIAAVLTLLIDSAGPRRVPTLRRQVDKAWLDIYRDWVYGAGFGLQLGVGLATVVTTASVYAMLAAEFLSAAPGQGALVGFVFGLVRGLSLLPGGTVSSPARLERFTVALLRSEAWSYRASLGAQVTIITWITTAVALQ